MLYQLIDVRFTPECKELHELLTDNCFEFESSDDIVSSLEEHYNIKIESLAWCNVIDQIDSDGKVTVTLNNQCVIIPAIMNTRLVGIPPNFRYDPKRKLIGGFNMILAEWIHNYKCHDDAVNNRDIDPYNGSPFQIYKDMSSKRKGKFFEMIVAEYCENLGCLVERATNSEHDRIISKQKAEIKGSTLWEGHDELFRWQQIRPNQDYDIMIFLAMYPDRVDLFASKKKDVVDYVTKQDEDGNFIHNQHGGKSVDSGTYFIQGKPSDFPFFRPIQSVI
tara:strand:- start:20098 stop:20928 length:831 start_codon:yes stop_codon:yes gene_type:complete